MTNIEILITQLLDESNDNVHKTSDNLGHIGTEEVIDAMIELLNHPNLESRYLAARTLGLIEQNEKALDPMLDAIKNTENYSITGDLLMELEGFDLSKCYVEIFKLFLNGSFKVSNIAKDLLDHEEFDITPRVIKKAEKHWNHYSNNIKHDDVYALRKFEVEQMLGDLRNFVNSKD